jgi:hypothetical protein
MKTFRQLACLVLLLSLCIPVVVQAQGPYKDILVGETFTLHDGETYPGDLVALGSTVTLEAGSRVDGTVVLLGGSLTASGKIEKDLAAIGGSIHLTETVEIGGDVSIIGSSPTIDTGARVTGEIRSAKDFSFSESFTLWNNPSDTSRWFPYFFSNNAFWNNPLFELTASLFRILLLSAIAVLVMLFLPAPTERIARAVVTQPWLSLAVGFATLLGACILGVIFILSCCLIPVGFLGFIILFAAMLVGWVGMSLELGKRMAPIFHTPLHPAAQAGIGALVLTFLATGVSYFPCLGPILVYLVSSVGLGAVVLTRFGGREYRGGSPAVAVPAESDSPAGPEPPSV